jgi:hypothetical protein
VVDQDLQSVGGDGQEKLAFSCNAGCCALVFALARTQGNLNCRDRDGALHRRAGLAGQHQSHSLQRAVQAKVYGTPTGSRQFRKVNRRPTQVRVTFRRLSGAFQRFEGLLKELLLTVREGPRCLVPGLNRVYHELQGLEVVP